jgi:hypothetical protein
MNESLYIKYFLFFLIGLFVGRITMAIQYALLKDLTQSKDLLKKIEGKVGKIYLDKK